MAQLLALMPAAFQRSSTDACADMFGLEVLLCRGSWAWASMLTSGRHSLARLLLSTAALLSAFVSPTVKLGPTDPLTEQFVRGALQTRYGECRPAATALLLNRLVARCTSADVTPLWTQVSTGKTLLTRLIAARNFVLTRLAFLLDQFLQLRLATRTAPDDIW